MSAHHLKSPPDHRQSVPVPGHAAAYCGELRSALRRRAIENGIDPVRVRGLLHAVDQAVAAIQAGASFPAVVQRLHGAVATLFPASPDLDRVMLEHATSILMVAAIQTGSELSAQILDLALERETVQDAVPAREATGGDRAADPLPAHIGDLRQGEERFLALVQNSSDIFGIVSRQGRIEYLSRSIERVLGYDPDALHGTSLLDLAGPGERATLAAAFDSALAKPQAPQRIGASLVHRDGTSRWMEIDLTNLDDSDGLSGVVVAARDVTTRKAAEDQLQRLAYFDSLTSLPNRVQFRERLEEALTAAAGSGATTGVIFIDLDRFKAINDRFGHDRGDAALVAVGERLQSAMQPGDLAARYGGEEFAVLLHDTSPGQAMRVARRVIRAVANAFAGHDGSGMLSASAGVALWSDTMRSAQELVRAADLALYRSKARGGSLATLYRPELAATAEDGEVACREPQPGAAAIP